MTDADDGDGGSAIVDDDIEKNAPEPIAVSALVAAPERVTGPKLDADPDFFADTELAVFTDADEGDVGTDTAGDTIVSPLAPEGEPGPGSPLTTGTLA